MNDQITARVSSLDGAGMDGGVGDVSAFGGGEFKMRIYTTEVGRPEAKVIEQQCMHNEMTVSYFVLLPRQRCCWTPYLNTKDDNWERGEANHFIGSAQIGSECYGFEIKDGESVNVTLKHKGNDGGLLDYVSFRGAFGILDHFYKCRS